MLTAFAGASAAMILSHHAQAAFTGLSIQSSTIGTRTIHRLFADFSNQADVVLMWGAGDPTDPAVLLTNATAGSIIIRNVLADGVTPGGGFLNQLGGGGNSLPSSATAPTDSFYTIGDVAGSFPATGDPWLTNFGMPSLGTVSVPGPPNLTLAGVSGQIVTIPHSSAATGNQPNNCWFAGSVFDGNPDAVLLAQLAVGLGQHVQGTIGLIWAAQGSMQNLTVVSNLTFNSLPAPGGLALIGAASLIRSRRRYDR